MTSVTRHHDFSAGHRVVDHEGKCKHLHGHNYRVHFTCVAGGGLDHLGRVVDFSVIKSTLCQWLEDNWDHRMLVSMDDPLLPNLQAIDPVGVVAVPFNPTAEKMAEYLVHAVGPQALHETGVKLVRVTIEETRKCSATYELRAVL
jgi:6-pyruvoyltetrahydropterin/6-carboxytetrahydropterin synthase